MKIHMIKNILLQQMKKKKLQMIFQKPKIKREAKLRKLIIKNSITIYIIMKFPLITMMKMK